MQQRYLIDYHQFDLIRMAHLRRGVDHFMLTLGQELVINAAGEAVASRDPDGRCYMVMQHVRRAA